MYPTAANIVDIIIGMRAPQPKDIDIKIPKRNANAPARV
jgi:hypothetical protein